MTMIDPFDNGASELAKQIDNEIISDIIWWQYHANIHFVWSSGLEEWEKIKLTYEDFCSLQYQHTKIMFGEHVAIYKDKTGRYISSRNL